MRQPFGCRVLPFSRPGLENVPMPTSLPPALVAAAPAPSSMYSVDIQVHASGKYFVVHLVQNLAEGAGFRCAYSAGSPHDIFPQPALSCRLIDIGTALITVGTVGNHTVNINTYYNPPELKDRVIRIITEVLNELPANKDVDGVSSHRGSRY